MKVIVLSSLLQVVFVHGWTSIKYSPTATAKSLVKLSATAKSTEEESNPCWQDIYDDDCAMSNAFAANFVAGKWIKGMPCAEGIEVGLISMFE